MKIFTHPTSESIIKKTATLVKEVSDAQKKCVVFSEDKINLSLELEIAKALGGGFFDVDVFTFRRYVYSVSPSDKILSEQSSVMLIRKILAEKTSELSCFKGSALGPNMALTLYELISQLKSAKVSPSDLFGLIEGTHLKDGALRSKLCDVYLIYKTYCEYVLNSGFYDRNDYLSLMPQTVIGDPNLKGAVIILSGFPSVTRQRFDVFRALNTVASEVYAVVPYDENSSVYTGETLNRLLEIDGGASIISSPRLDFEKEALKKYLFSHDVFKSDFKPFTTDKISLYRAYDTADEIDFIARDIISEVRLSGYRYKDIVLAVGSLAETLPLLTRTFKDYNIPFYAEKQSSLAEHPLSQFIISFLDMARKGVPVKEFVKIIGHAVLISNKQVADGFISYIYKNAVSKYAVKKPFTFESENLSVYEGYRAKIIALCEELSKCKTVTDYIKAITNVIKTLNIENNVKELSKKLCAINELVSAEFNDDVLPKINDVLSEMENVLGGGKITALDFKNVLLSGFNATKVGAIPILNDAVYVGELKDIKLKGAKVLYALSLNGDVPFTQSDTSLLTDGDLAVLDGFNVIVEPKIKVVNDRDRESVLMALTSFEDKLKLSYSLVNSAQSAVYKSELIKSVTKIFNLNVLTRQAILDGIENGLEEYKKYELGAYSSRETALREIASTYTEYKLSSKNALKKVASFYEALEGLNYKDLIDKTNELFQDEEKDVYVDKAYVKSATSGEISATTLETFFSCPFKSYGQKILKLSETETGEVKANETGTLLHAVLERYVQNMDRVSDKISSDMLVEEIIESVIKEDKQNKYNAQNPVLEFELKRTVKEAKRVCFDVFVNQKRSKFVPTYFEKEFGNGKTIPAIKLNAKGGEVGVRGAVDRVDYYGDYVRIIDYKSGAINSSTEGLYTGNKLQLYLYMNAFTGDGKKPSGAYYYSVKDEFSLDGVSPAMSGKTVCDKDIIMATDGDLKPRDRSKIVNVALTKDGEVHGSSQTLTEKQFNDHLKYSVKVCEKCVDEIRSGYITATPYKGACTYCSYSAMCGFSEENGSLERKEDGVSVETISNALEKGGE